MEHQSSTKSLHSDNLLKGSVNSDELFDLNSEITSPPLSFRKNQNQGIDHFKNLISIENVSEKSVPLSIESEISDDSLDSIEESRDSRLKSAKSHPFLSREQVKDIIYLQNSKRGVRSLLFSYRYQRRNSTEEQVQLFKSFQAQIEQV